MGFTNFLFYGQWLIGIELDTLSARHLIFLD